VPALLTDSVWKMCNLLSESIDIGDSAGYYHGKDLQSRLLSVTVLLCTLARLMIIVPKRTRIPAVIAVSED